MGPGGGLLANRVRNARTTRNKRVFPTGTGQVHKRSPSLFFHHFCASRSQETRPKKAPRDKVTPMTYEYSYKRSAPGRATAKPPTYSSISNLAKTLTYGELPYCTYPYLDNSTARYGAEHPEPLITYFAYIMHTNSWGSANICSKTAILVDGQFEILLSPRILLLLKSGKIELKGNAS